ncbi:MAG: ParA family protein, partial [Pseudomonadota bacterium]
LNETKDFDYVIIDCPPAFSTLTQAALSLADLIISPVLEEPLSAWSVVAFRDFGMKQSLNAWRPELHRILFTRVSRRGANEERIAIRNDLRTAGFEAFPVGIREASDAHRWAKRIAPDSTRSFSNKYGREKANVEDLGKSVVDALK